MASIYEEGLQLIDEKFGNGKDNIRGRKFFCVFKIGSSIQLELDM